jgi:hypothetical protein
MKPTTLLEAAKDKRLLGAVHPLRGPQLRLLEAMGSDAMLALISAGRQSGNRPQRGCWRSTTRAFVPTSTGCCHRRTAGSFSSPRRTRTRRG